MTREELTAYITECVLQYLQKYSVQTGVSAKSKERPRDITSEQVRQEILLNDPLNEDVLRRMKKSTTARIGVGKTGARLNTQTMLTLRADHANARDSVLLDVDPDYLEKLGLFSVQTQCSNKDEYLTRPDLGRRLSKTAEETLRSRCKTGADVQIIVSDGLSSAAVTANINRLLPVLEDSLKAKGIRLGTPFFVKYGRVAIQDPVSELLGAKAVCLLIGERPGLGSAESLSAYICYNARVGMPESRRTVVSNIHKDGINAVEAGAYIAEIIEKILEAKVSGVQLRR